MPVPTRVLDYADAHPGHSAASVARRFGLSPRAVQRALKVRAERQAALRVLPRAPAALSLSEKLQRAVHLELDALCEAHGPLAPQQRYTCALTLKALLDVADKVVAFEASCESDDARELRQIECLERIAAKYQLAPVNEPLRLAR